MPFPIGFINNLSFWSCLRSFQFKSSTYIFNGVGYDCFHDDYPYSLCNGELKGVLLHLTERPAYGLIVIEPLNKGEYVTAETLWKCGWFASRSHSPSTFLSQGAYCSPWRPPPGTIFKRKSYRPRRSHNHWKLSPMITSFHNYCADSPIHYDVLKSNQ